MGRALPRVRPGRTGRREFATGTHQARRLAETPPADHQCTSDAPAWPTLARSPAGDRPLDDLCGAQTLRALADQGPRRRAGPALQWPCPGNLVHLDIKKLGRIGRGGGKRVRGVSAESRTGRGLGWDFVHVAIDDHSRLAYAEICPDERAETTVAFTSRALGFFESAGVVTRRVITDNGAAYRSLAFTGMLKARGIEVKKTRPYRPQTNGKAEAFVKIVTNEWAYGASYSSNAERAEMLGPFLDYYNRSRPHGGIGFQPPISRVE